MKVLSKKKLLKQYGFPREYLTFRVLPLALSQANLCRNVACKGCRTWPLLKGARVAGGLV